MVLPKKYDDAEFVSALISVTREFEALSKASYYKEEGIFGELCKALKTKNSLNNRKKFHARCFRDNKVQDLFLKYLVGGTSAVDNYE